MIWTMYRPTKPGWYWFQQDSEYPECVEIYGHADDGLRVASQASTGETVFVFCDRFIEYGHTIRWSSEPITEPQEPA